MRWISNHATNGPTLASVAGRQEGVISRRQVEALGVSSRQIDRLIRDGHLVPIFHGVFAVGHAAIGARAGMRAAALACPGAVISHRSAAALLGFGKAAPVVVDLIPTVERGRRIDGIRPHRVAFPGPSECVRVGGIPCTSVARTVVDLAGVHGEKEMRGTVERAATERLLDLVAIDAVLAEGPRRRGAPCLRRVLADWRRSPRARATRTSAASSRPSCCRSSFPRNCRCHASTPRSEPPSAPSRSTSSGTTPASSSRPTAVAITPSTSPSTATVAATANS
jgi:hypothetical protein